MECNICWGQNYLRSLCDMSSSVAIVAVLVNLKAYVALSLARLVLNVWRRHKERDSKGKQMKLIIAYIQPERLNAVKQALFAREIYKMSVTNALGCGKQGGYLHLYRGAVEEVTLHKKMRLAIAVNDDYIEKTIDAIIEGARTGDIGDGKIFVLPMDECVRIRTGERGPAAIG